MRRDRLIKGKVILGCVLLATGLAGAAPALGQEGGAYYTPEGEPPPSVPDYAFRDGEVYVDGDLAIGCREFAGSFEEGYDEWGDQAQARRVLEQCERAGMPTLRLPEEVRREIRQDAPNAAVPETGGVSPASLAAGLFLTSAGVCLLALRAI